MRVCTAHTRYVPTLPDGLQRKDVELPDRLFSSIPRSSVLCNGCLDSVLASFARDLAASIRARGLSPEDAALELLTRWGWNEPYTGRERSEKAVSGPIVLAAAFGQNPEWAMKSALKTAAFLYAHFQRGRGERPPTHEIVIWDQTPENIIGTELCQLWEFKAWDSDSGDLFMWVGAHGGTAPAPQTLHNPVHLSAWRRFIPAMELASADPLADQYSRDTVPAENRYLDVLLRAATEARQPAG